MYVQGGQNSSLIIGISETVRDTGSVKLWQSCAIWCLIRPRLEIRKIPNIFGDIRKNRNFLKSFWFFSKVIWRDILKWITLRNGHFFRSTRWLCQIWNQTFRFTATIFNFIFLNTDLDFSFHFSLPLDPLNTMAYHSFTIFKRFNLRTEILCFFCWKNLIRPCLKKKMFCQYFFLLLISRINN